MKSNAQLKRSIRFALNQKLIGELKQLKDFQERLLIALNEGIVCAFNGEDNPRQTIANMDYKRALGQYVDMYCETLKTKQDIKDIDTWEIID